MCGKHTTAVNENHSCAQPLYYIFSPLIKYTRIWDSARRCTPCFTNYLTINTVPILILSTEIDSIYM